MGRVLAHLGGEGVDDLGAIGGGSDGGLRLVAHVEGRHHVQPRVPRRVEEGRVVVVWLPAIGADQSIY